MATIPRFQKPRAEPKRKPTPALPIISRRSVLLDIEGAGKTPCMTAGHSWLGCCSGRDTDDVCYATGRRCILAPYRRAMVTESADLVEDVENIKRLIKPTRGKF